jgi:hypothetical protein
MKYWLIIFLANPNLPSDSNYVGKIEIQYPSKAACETALRTRAYRHEFISKDVIAIEDPGFAPDCYSDNHVKGIAQDPGKRYD